MSRLHWRLTARSSQLTPDGDWYAWLILAGRGWGKTRTGAEDMAYYGMTNQGSRLAVVAPTAASVRDVCVEGESGLLSVIPRQLVKHWNRSLGEMALTNGTLYKLFSADEPDRLRGYQHHRAWCDELASWRYPDAWDQLLLGLRLGRDPRVVVTTTPRPVAVVRSLLERDGVVVTRGSTFENSDNLPEAALAQLRDRYEGTRIGRQELYAELLDDIDTSCDSTVGRHPSLSDPVILPPLEPTPGGLVLFSPAQWGWITKSLRAIFLAQDIQLRALGSLTQGVENIMVDLSGVTQALADFKAEVAVHATKIDAELAQLLAAQGSGDQAAVDAIAASINEETAALQAMDVSLDADDPAV